MTCCADLLSKIAGWLVREDQVRFVHERTGDCDALFLPAREFCGPEVDPITEADKFQKLGTALERFRAFDTVAAPR